ncbi:siderophore-interacting protein [Halotalea alkalilenta]|uniref:siderophore-interacting protein n=1 Tax=Halotalea alkalilenta TaxID=376489 RepID=UPI000486F15F|nr:siderophore-interacting protein [Halotalea alkalilenta]
MQHLRRPAGSPAPRKKRAPSLFEVLRTERLSPRMIRVVLGGEGIDAFDENAYAAHIKLMLPRPGQREPSLPTLGEQGPVWPPASQRPIVRTYSVRACDRDKGELVVDFVAHGDEGPASRWALAARPGDRIGIAGPGGPMPMLKPADWTLLAGDMTALPAIAAMLERLPEDARGCALIEIPDPAERQELRHPSGVELRWLVREAKSPSESRLLLDAAIALDIPSQASLFAWVGGENAAVIALRDHLRDRHSLRKPMLYAVPYWKYTLDEETYHQERHRVMDEL